MVKGTMLKVMVCSSYCKGTCLSVMVPMVTVPMVTVPMVMVQTFSSLIV